MYIKTITYERLFNRGSFENERFGGTVELQEGEDPLEGVALLVQQVEAADAWTLARREEMRQERIRLREEAERQSQAARVPPGVQMKPTDDIPF
jgi:hypothetical protein